MDIINACFETTNEVRVLALYTHLIPIISILFLGLVVFFRSKDRVKSYFFLGFAVTFSMWLAGNLLNWISNDYYLVAATWAPLDFINIVFFLFLFLFITSRSEYSKLSLFTFSAIFIAAIIPFWVTVTGNAVYEFYEPVCEMITNPFISNYKLILESILLIGALIIGGYQIRHTPNRSRESTLKQLSILGFIALIMAVFAGAEFASTYTEIYEIHLYALLTLPPFVLILSILVTAHEKMNIGDISLKVFFFLFLIISASQFMFVESNSDLIILLISFSMAVGFGALLFKITEDEKRAREQVEHLAENLKHMNERLTELDKMKTEFVSIASHQMRSPLTAISGYSSLILEGSYGATSREVKDAISKIFRSSKSMSVAVDDFLNVTRIEQGRIQLDKENFDMRELVQNTYDEYVFVAQQRGLDLQLDVETQTPVPMYGDRNKIKQSLNNLVDNALKYTKEGWVRIGLTCTEECATLSIADSGIGIPAADHEHLFEKFTRATNANSATVQGTGLGLYIVKHFVNMHQGQIWFESDDGKGTTFFISLPITKEPDGHEHKTKVIDLLHESGPEPGERGSNRR